MLVVLSGLAGGFVSAVASLLDPGKTDKGYEATKGVPMKGTLSGMIACPPNGVDVFAQFNNTRAVYKDFVQSFSTVEPAIDLTASSPLAFAWQIAGAPSGTP